MTYHIIIQQERRVSTEEQPRELALSISTSKPTGNIVNDMPEHVVDRTQLHTITGATLSETDFSDPQFVMVAEWNLTDPYVVCHKGDYSARTMHYAGWPVITKEEYDALPVLSAP